MNQIVTTHSLDFEWAPWDDEYSKYRIGTCEGLYGYGRDQKSKAVSLDILAVQNREQGNGHFEDVMEWFEFAAKRDKLILRVIEIHNARLFIHLIEKRGFTPQLFAHQINVIKDLNNPAAPVELSDTEKAHAKEVMNKVAAVMQMVSAVSLTDIPGDDDKPTYWAEEAAERLFW